MKSLGNIDLQNNLLMNTVLEQVENFPASPKVGHFIFKSQRVMICIALSDGLPIWAPLTAALNTHIHEQGTAASTWTINHQLNTSVVLAQVIDNNGKHIIPDEITCNFNQTVITFYEQVAGKAVLMIGEEEGNSRNDTNFEASFTNSDTWVVNHVLGYEPIIRVFVGNQEVQPASITHDSLNQATITFSSPQTGYVRCV